MNTPGIPRRRSACVFLLLLMSLLHARISQGAASVVSGGFETGQLTPWAGAAGLVQAGAGYAGAYLDNVSSDRAFVDRLSIREVLADGTLGGEQIRHSRGDMPTTILRSKSPPSARHCLPFV
jgi:hypothetical protein